MGLNKMKFSKSSVEYRKNGVYEVNGSIWATLWAYKTAKGLTGNDPKQNTIDSLMLTQRGLESIVTIPDIKRYSEVKAFRVADLEQYL